MQQFGTTEDVSPEQFAAAVLEHVRWWEREDVEFQLRQGGISGLAGTDAVVPGAFLDYYSTVDDATLAKVARRPDVAILSARGTKITDAGLAHLAGLTALERLDVSETSITDDGLRHLEQLKSLKTLGVKGTQVTPTGIERLKAALPNVELGSIH
jgi:hypothetical protein